MGCTSSKENVAQRAIPRDSIYVAKKKAKRHEEKTGQSMEYKARRESDALQEAYDKIEQ
jgi:hypothetical protein